MKKQKYQTDRQLILDYGKDISVLKKELKELQNKSFIIYRKLQNLWDIYENDIINKEKVKKILDKFESKKLIKKNKKRRTT